MLRNNKSYFLFLIVVITIISGCAGSHTTDSGANQFADTIYLNGKIFTVNKAQPWAEAVAIKDGKFISVGTYDSMAEFKGDKTNVVDLNGKLVIPGLIDPHTHAFEDYHNRYFAFGVEDNSTPDTILAEVKAYADANPDKEWIIGGMYPSGMFPGDNGPRELIDAVVVGRPVCLADQSGHSWWCNTKALELTGIMNLNTKLPEGSIVVRDANGVPSGTVKEHAIGYMRQFIPPIPQDEWVETGRGFMNLFNSLGLTSTQLAAGNESHLKAARAIESDGDLSVRLIVALNYGYFDSPETIEQEYEFIGRAHKYRSEFLNPGYVKIFLDGVPTSRTGWLVDPYPGTDSFGVGYYEPEELVALHKDFTSKGVGIMSHATGSRSVREALNAIQITQEAFPDSTVRHHVTHNGIIHPDDIGRFKELGIAIDVAPTMPITPVLREMMEPIIGAKNVDNYADARAALDSGAYVAVGSDWQVSFLDPWRRMAFHVSRRDTENPDWGVLVPEKALTVDEAIEVYTIGPAYAMNVDKETGSIEVGKYADIIVLDRNIFDIDPLEIAETKVLTTVFAGKVVYEAR